MIPESIFYSLLLECVWTRGDVYQRLPVYYLPIARKQSLVHPSILFGSLNLLFIWAIYMSSIIGQRKQRHARAGLVHLLIQRIESYTCCCFYLFERQGIIDRVFGFHCNPVSVDAKLPAVVDVRVSPSLRSPLFIQTVA